MMLHLVPGELKNWMSQLQASGAAVAVFGYRMGARTTAAGMLFIAGMSNSWSIAFIFYYMALFILGLLFYIHNMQIQILQKSQKHSFSIFKKYN
jgi:hypothetical protein